MLRRTCRAGCLGLVVLLAALPATASAADPGTLGVSGRGDVEVTPDIGAFTAQVVRTAADADSARNHANTRLRAIVAAVTALGVPRSSITTTNVSLSRERRRNRKTRALSVRYTAAGAFAVRVEGLDKLGSALDAAGWAGATELDGPFFSFSSALQTESRLGAERLALIDARRRADDAAASQGSRVSGVQSLELDPSSAGPLPQSESATAAPAPTPARSRPAVPTPVLPGTQTFSSVVRVVYTLQPAG